MVLAHLVLNFFVVFLCDLCVRLVFGERLQLLSSRITLNEKFTVLTSRKEHLSWRLQVVAVLWNWKNNHSEQNYYHLYDSTEVTEGIYHVVDFSMVINAHSIHKEIVDVYLIAFFIRKYQLLNGFRKLKEGAGICLLAYPYPAVLRRQRVLL